MFHFILEIKIIKLPLNLNFLRPAFRGFFLSFHMGFLCDYKVRANAI
jgi:hypothetical protein